MLFRPLIAILAPLSLLVPALAVAQSAPAASAEQEVPDSAALVGVWDFRIDGATVFRFDIEEGQDGEWSGRWRRPEMFNTDGNNFSGMRGPVKTTASMTGIIFAGLVELSFDDPRPGAVPDIFRFRMTGPDTAEMTYVGTELAPYSLERSSDLAAMGDWNPQRVYRRQLAPAVGEDEFRLTPSGPASRTGAPAGAIPAATAPAATPPPTAPAAEPAQRSRIGSDFLTDF